MAEITAIFSDIGGVLLTNGWDRNSRRRFVEEFHLDWEEFEDRHELLAAALDKGQLSLDDYIDRALFYRERPFTKADVRQFIYTQSQSYPESLALLVRVADAKKYLVASLNNESAELNAYRIQRFALRRCFTIFFSSCYLGVRKPEAAIYRLALAMTQRDAGECIFIDDRALNLECAADLGIHTIQYQSPQQLGSDLRRFGVQLENQ
jgi:putative hydrolase of the HAD superfamily